MGDAYARVTVAAVQAAPAVLDREASLAKLGALVQAAADLGARIIVLPEAFIPAYPTSQIFGAVFGGFSDPAAGPAAPPDVPSSSATTGPASIPTTRASSSPPSSACTRPRSSRARASGSAHHAPARRPGLGGERAREGRHVLLHADARGAS